MDCNNILLAWNKFVEQTSVSKMVTLNNGVSHQVDAERKKMSQDECALEMKTVFAPSIHYREIPDSLTDSIPLTD